MPLDILGLVSIDTLDFLDGKSYVGGGGLATAWISALWDVDTTLYSINSSVRCNRIIDGNLSKQQCGFHHVPLGVADKTTCFNILQDNRTSDYIYRITHLNGALGELVSFFAQSKHEQYIKLPASNFFQLKSRCGHFSVNPQGSFNLIEFCNAINTSGFVFLNKKELLDSSNVSLLGAFKYIENMYQSFVITLGEEGSICYYSIDKTWWYCPSIFSDDYISTLGCGDSFAGGFLAAYIKQKPINECLAQGTISAYYTMQSPSNMITRCFDDKSLNHIVELSKYTTSFLSAKDLHEYINSSRYLHINLDLSFDQLPKFCWLYL